MNSPACKHVAQFYDDDERPLISGVARFLGEGLRRGGTLVVVTNDDRRVALFRDLEELGIAPALVIRSGRLRVLRSEDTLPQFYEDGRLSYSRFERIAGGLMREMSAVANGRGLRAYGDMVDQLWQRGDREGAIELERFWNRLQSEIPFDLYCAYPRQDQTSAQSIAGVHTEVLSA